MALLLLLWSFLTDGIFETGAYGVPSKSQNPTVLDQGGPSSHLVPNVQTLAGHVHLAPTMNFCPKQICAKLV